MKKEFVSVSIEILVFSGEEVIFTSEGGATIGTKEEVVPTEGD